MGGRGWRAPARILDVTHIFSLRTQPQRGLTTKPGVAVAAAHTRKNHTKSVEPQRGSTSPLDISVQPSKAVEPRWGSGRSSFTLPGVRRNAATPGYVVKPVPG